MKKLSKIISIMMAVVMLVTMLPMVVANAAEGGGALELNTPVELSADSTTYIFSFSPEKDGWYVFYSEGVADTYAFLMNADYEEINYSDDDTEDNQFIIVNKLYAGYTYILEVSAYDDDLEPYTVTVEETIAAESAEITQEPFNPVVEGYEYETMDYQGLEVEFTMTDGSTVYWTYEDYNLVGYEHVRIEDGNDGMGHYYIDIICGEAFARYFYETIENPVESMEYSCDEDIFYYENSFGYYDEELGYYVYYYEIPGSALMTINYKDGTSETMDYFGDDIYFYDYTTQETEAWNLGTNYIYVSYLGVETTIPVEILPCPFVDVTLNSPPETEYVWGDSRYGFIDDYDGNYYLYPDNMSGISFTVEYADGSTQTYTEDDFDNKGQLDGYIYECDVITCDALGEYKAAINYKGYRIEYDIEVVESPIEGIELSDAPDNYVYDSYFYPVFDGAQIKLTFKDGTTKLIDITPENTGYNCYYGEFEYVFTDGEYEVFARYNYSEASGEYYTFDCLGYEYDYYGIEFEDEFFVDYVEFENVEYNKFDAVVVDTDGVVHEYSLDTTVNYSVDGFFEGYCMTEDGILYYAIYETTDYYRIWFMGDEYYIPYEQYLVGDVNGDGQVSVMDATFIQRYLVQQEELTDEQLLAADVDGNGIIEVMDATQIQRYIAQIIPEL